MVTVDQAIKPTPIKQLSIENFENIIVKISFHDIDIL